MIDIIIKPISMKYLTTTQFKIPPLTKDWYIATILSFVSCKYTIQTLFKIMKAMPDIWYSNSSHIYDGNLIFKNAGNITIYKGRPVVI